MKQLTEKVDVKKSAQYRDEKIENIKTAIKEDHFNKRELGLVFLSAIANMLEFGLLTLDDYYVVEKFISDTLDVKANDLEYIIQII